MDAIDQQKQQRFLVGIAFWAVILALIYLVFKHLIHLLMPFFLALIFAMVMRPVVRLLVKRCRFRQGFAAVLVTLLFFLTIGSLLILLMFELINGIGNVFSMLPALYRDTIEPGLQDIFVYLEEVADRFDLDVLETLESAVPEILSAAGSAVSSLSGTVVSWVSSLVTKLPGFLVSLIICIIATFFMAVDYTRMVNVLMRQLPDRTREIVIGVRRSLSKVMLQYGRSYLLILTITFVELTIGMFLLRVKSPVLIAALIAVLDIFPILGTGTVLWPWAIISLVQGNLGRGIGLIVVYFAITIIRQVIEPRIVGKHVGLHPLITLMCMFVGSSLFGVLGLFGLPIMMAIVLELNDNDTIHLFKTEATMRAGHERAKTAVDCVKAQPEDERAAAPENKDE